MGGGAQRGVPLVATEWVNKRGEGALTSTDRARLPLRVPASSEAPNGQAHDPGGQHGPRQHSTARHGTAQHSTAQHSTPTAQISRFVFE